MPPRVSVCMIVKDEAGQLPDCLASVAGVADELIVVDTGSVDATVALAEAAGARVFHHRWTGDFSAARNVSLDHATGDWIFVLDADERLTAGETLRAAVAAAGPEVESFTLPLINFVGEQAYQEAVTSPSVRLFRNRPEHRFRRALHEQIAEAIQAARPEAACLWLDAPIEHFGYLNAIVHDRDKIARNLAIARAELERNPEDAFTWYNLGQEYFRLRQWDEAIAAYQRAFPHLGSLILGFAPALIKHLAISLLNAGRPEDAIAVCRDAMEAYPDFTDLWVLEGLSRMEQEQFEPAAEAFRQALDKGEVSGGFYFSDEGVGSYKAWWWLAHCHARLGRLDAAEEEFGRSLTGVIARQRYLAQPLQGLFQVWQSQGLEVAAMLDRLAAWPALDDPRWRALAGQVALERRLLPLADHLLEPAAPQPAKTRLAHGLARLRQRDVAGALACWAPIPATDPLASEAAWHRLLAPIVAGDGAAAEEALAAIDPGGDEAGLVAIYRGLLQLWAGQPTAPPELPDGPRDRWQENLEGLLSLLLETESYELFGGAIESLGWLGLPEAAQAGLLGRLYHQAGLAEAAREALGLAISAGLDQPGIWRLYGLLCLSARDYPAASEALGRWLEGDPAPDERCHRHTVMVAYLAALQAQGRAHEAGPLWQEPLPQS